MAAHPDPSSSPCAAGTSANCAMPPTAPARPSARLRCAAPVIRLSAPYTTPKVVPDSAMPMHTPADQTKAGDVSACVMPYSPAA
ncbi:hypothetical protein D9M69_137820 [compost metagenome]